MEETEILLTVAEIGVALAGFASLAAVLGRRFGDTDPLVNAVRLRGLLDAGLSAMLLALVAVLMLAIGGRDLWVWRAAAVIGLVFVGTIGSAAYRRERLRRHLRGFRKGISAVMFVLVASTFLAFAAVAAGLAPGYGFQVYFAALCLLLLICCSMFVLVIASLVRPEAIREPRADPGS